MKMSAGMPVVHPRHGAGVVAEVTTDPHDGVEHVSIDFAEQRLRVTLPTSSAEKVGLREPLDRKRVEEVLDVLRSPAEAEPDNWSRRFKATEEKLRSGDPHRIAEAVRDLSRREAAGSLSAGERKLLSTGESLLASEACFALGISATETTAVLREAALEH